MGVQISGERGNEQAVQGNGGIHMMKMRTMLMMITDTNDNDDVC